MSDNVDGKRIYSRGRGLLYNHEREKQFKRNATRRLQRDRTWLPTGQGEKFAVLDRLVVPAAETPIVPVVTLRAK